MKYLKSLNSIDRSRVMTAAANKPRDEVSLRSAGGKSYICNNGGALTTAFIKLCRSGSLQAK
jgi:hypothetical protein